MPSDTRYRDAGFLEKKYVEERLSLNDIADICGCDPKTVHYWLDKHDIETRSRGQHRLERASYSMNSAGYMNWQSFNTDDGSQDTFYVHRLLAVAEYGKGAVTENDVHHINEIKWDNRPDNIELVGHGEHAGRHGRNRGRFSDLDKIRMAELYRNGDVTQAEIGDIFGAHQAYVSDMIAEVTA